MQSIRVRGSSINVRSRFFFRAALMCPAVLNQYLIKLNEVCLWWNLKQIQNRFTCQWQTWKHRCSSKCEVSLGRRRSWCYLVRVLLFSFQLYVLGPFLLITHLYLFVGPLPPPLSSPPWGSPVCGTDADRRTDNVAQCLLFVNDSAATVYIHCFSAHLSAWWPTHVTSSLWPPWFCVRLPLSHSEHTQTHTQNRNYMYHLLPNRCSDCSVGQCSTLYYCVRCRRMIEVCESTCSPDCSFEPNINHNHSLCI